MLDKFKSPQKNKKKPEKLADTLLFFVNDTVLDKNNRSLKLDPGAERLRFIVYHALNSNACNAAIAASTSENSLKILKAYFGNIPKNKTFTTKLLKNREEKIEYLHKITASPKYGQVALLSVGNIDSGISSELKKKGVVIESLFLAEEISKRIVDSATSTAKDALDTISTFYGLFRNKNVNEIGLHLLSIPKN